MKILAIKIDVLAIFHIGESPIPYRFKYIDEAGEKLDVRVEKIISISEKRPAGIASYIYVCQSKICGKIVHYELKYIIENCIWELYKM